MPLGIFMFMNMYTVVSVCLNLTAAEEKSDVSLNFDLPISDGLFLLISMSLTI